MARRSSLKDQWPLDCTSDCYLKQHAKIILCCTALGNLQLLQHCASICGNPFKISDALGRNALHVAASRGHLHIVEWLLARGKGGPIDLADRESKWTALHRSVYFGHLGVAAHLIKSGASLNTEDFDGLNPLTLLNQDKRHFNTQQVLSSQNVYTWGTNSNVTLGHDRSKNYPERLELGTRRTITQMVLCKFHSVLLTAKGKVLTCGHGRGGRLGHGSEQSFVTPCEVEALAEVRCVGVAAARDHTAMLSDSGTVYTCGLNDAHQLGHGSNPSTSPQSCLAPKAVQVRALKNRHLIAVGVGRYHTAVCTTTEVYTFGKNLGQLGYERNYETQISPRAIPGVSLDEGDSITHLSVSDAATACLTRRHRIFVSADFTVRSIRCGFFEKTSCVQFCVCASLSDLDHLRKTETEPKKVLMLDSEHQVWYWEPMKKGSPNLLPGLARHKVTQFCLGKRLTVVTEQGEVHSGVASVQQPLRLARVPMVQSAQAVFTDFKANNFAYLQNVYRSPVLPSLAPSSLSSDLTSLLEEACLPGSVSDLDIEVSGRVYATHKFLLASSSPVLHRLVQPQQPGVNSSPVLRHLVQPLQPGVNSSGIPECVKSHSGSQLVLDCDPDLFEALLHFVYGGHIRINPPARDDYPPKYATASANTTLNSSTGLDLETTPDTSFASVDENDLTALYDQYAAVGPGAREDPLELQVLPGNVGQSTPKKKSGGRKKEAGQVVKHFASEGEPVWDLRPESLRSELQTLQSLAGELGVREMKEGLEELLTSSSLKHLCEPLTLVRTRPSLSCTPPYSDLTLVSSEGRGLPCHRCVLVARSDYFRSMLLMGWRESSGEGKSLSLPVSYRILETVIHYMYTDEAPSVTDSDSAQWITSVLVVADQLLITRLKDLCEYALARSLTLRSVSEVLEFAVAYSAEQLKRACLQFICVNAASLLERRYLDCLDSSVLVELSAAYRELAPAVTKRVIGFPDLDPSSLPESYFLGVGPEESPSAGSTSEGELPEGYAREDGELVRSPVPHEVVSPRTPLSSGSRKKRRRKGSQGESSRRPRGSSYSPPTSPTELESTPKSGINGQVSSERVSAGGNLEPDEASSGSGVLNNAAPISKPSPAPKGNPKRLMDRFGRDPLSPPRTTERPLVNGVCCNGHHKAEELPASTRESPPTAPTKVVRVPNGKLRSPLPSALLAAGKSAWSTLPVGSPQGSSLREIMAQEEMSSQKQLKKSPPQSQLSSSPASSHSRTPPPSHSRTPPPSQSRTSPQTIPSRPPLSHSKTPPQAVPGRRQSWQETRGDGITPSPSLSATPQSPSGNPWKTVDMATSPTLSLRDLMAEAKEEERKKVLQGVGGATAGPPSRPSSEDSSGKPAKRQPLVMVPHRQVSFADIVQSQEMEREDQRTLSTRYCKRQKLGGGLGAKLVPAASVGKPLSFIQIEEQVMEALKKLYIAQDNPDEYITVERCHSRRSSLSRQLSQNSPWGRDIR